MSTDTKSYSPFLAIILLLSVAITPLVRAQDSDSQDAKDQEQCRAWVLTFLTVASGKAWDADSVGVSRSERCAELVNEASFIEYMTSMRSKLFKEASYANSIYRECNRVATEQFRKCSAPNSSEMCPPSDYCMDELKRYACIFKEAKTYEAGINEMNEKRVASEVVDDLSREKCIGDESKLWDAIDSMWEILNQGDSD